MFEQLAAAIDAVDVPVHGDAIVAGRALIDRLEAKVAEAEAEYSKAREFEPDGFGSMAAFERHGCGQTLPESRRTARRAARLSAWPEVLEAWGSGRLTGTQVELMACKVPERHVERFAKDAVELIGIVSSLSAHQTGFKLTDWVQHADVLAEREQAEAGNEPSEVVPERELFASRSIGDVLFVNGTFDPDSAAIVEKALTAAGRADADGERRTLKERRADALVEVCRGYLAALENPDGNRNTERLTIVADIVALHRAALRGAGVATAAQLDRFLADHPDLGTVEKGLFLDAFDGLGGVARTLDGSPVSDALLSMVSSGGTLERLLTADRRILDHGRSIRSFTAAQRRSILARDGGCRTAGCDAGPDRCDVHHVVPWEAGGRSDIGNGVAKCRRCHLEHHRKRWRDRLDPDGTYTVLTSDGTELVSHPPGWEHQTRLPVHHTAEPARGLAAVHDRHRPRCDCPCPEHRGPDEEAEFRESRRLALARLDAAKRAA
ncbi:MAG TPA: HNH endonuclease signature motif containing protein [Acidimicrobiales bacterium]